MPGDEEPVVLDEDDRIEAYEAEVEPASPCRAGQRRAAPWWPQPISTICLPIWLWAARAWSSWPAAARMANARCWPKRSPAMRSARGLSVALVDAGSGRASEEPGISDLSLDAASFGDVVHKSADNSFAEVPWGQGAFARPPLA